MSLKKIRFYYRYVSAFVRKQYLPLLGGTLLGISAFWLIPQLVSLLPKISNPEKIGIVGRYTLNNLPNDILHDLSFGLTTYAQNGSLEGMLASSWQATDSGRTFIFQLNKNYRWHDGSPLIASDLIYNFKDVDVIASNDKISFTLTEPFAPLPGILSKPVIKEGLVGLGDNKLSQIKMDSQYLTSLTLQPIQNNLPNRIYRFYQTQEDQITAFNLGEINRLLKIYDTTGIIESPSVTVEKLMSYDNYLALFFDTASPILSEKSYRQAIAYAIPKESGVYRALGPIPPSSICFNSDIKSYDYNLTRAKELLEKSGPEIKNTPLIPSTFPQYQSQADIIAQSLTQLGLKVEIRFTNYLPEQYDLLLVSRQTAKDPDLYSQWHSTQPGNISHFKNPRIDKLLEDGRREVDTEKRKVIYLDFQRFLSEESPAVFLTYPPSYNVIRR